MRYLRLTGRQRRLTWLVLAVLLTAGLGCAAVLHMRPIIVSLATARVSNAVNRIVVDAVRDAILTYKFRGRVEYLNCFGALMAETAASAFADRFDAVTWVPVSGKRLKKRGFDQSRMLCASLCVDWHTQPLETLRKVRDNPAQSGIDDPAERRANVLGAYEPVDPDAIAGKRFLLIDDIITTGATLTECVRVLKAAGAADVVCLTLAMARDN